MGLWLNSGMKKWQLMVASVVAVALIASGAWLMLQPEQESTAEEFEQESEQETSMLIDDDTPPANQQYSSSEMAISFSYPSDWLTLECEDSPNTVYLASDDRGLGLDETGESILCGAGTDFAPQAVIFQREQIDQPAGGPTEVMIGGVQATRYVLVANGEGLRPNGFTTYSYVIPRSNGETLVAVYNQYPETVEGYDTSNESKEIFLSLVEEELELEL